MIKISRDICIIRFRKFPLRSFEKNDEVSYYPEVISKYWLKLEHKSTKRLTSILSEQITELYKKLDISNLIFLCDFNTVWVSKPIAERKNYQPLLEAVEYFTKHKVGSRFNGGIKVNINELQEFIKHFYTLTRCDGGFSYYHFLDEDQNILAFIHYSGEICFETLDKNFEPIFVKEIAKTLFQNVDSKE